MVGVSPKLFTLLLLSTLYCILEASVKLKLASEHECDRQSLDALYHEKYEPETENALTGITEFVNRTADHMIDSLTRIMADLPGRESSGVEERKVYTTFKEMKKKFLRSVNKLKINMTSAWESLLEANYELMLDSGKFTINDVLNRTIHVTDVYTSSRSVLDVSLGTVVSSLKEIIRKSLQGISSVAEKEVQREEMEKSKKSNDTSENTDGDEEASQDAGSTKKESRGESNQELGKEQLLKNKKKEIVDMLAPQFLGKVSVIIVDKDVDLERNVATKSEDRDSVLDDMCFTLIMMRSRVNSVIHEDAMRSKETQDLARRNLYIYFAERAAQMYKDKLKGKHVAPSTGSGDNQQLEKDEKELAETLVSLMENYP